MSRKHTYIITVSVIILVCILVGVYLYYSVDGFQTPPKELNVVYQPREVFLVVPQGSTQGGNKAAAEAVCSSYGATLATPAQLDRAVTLGAKWSLPGWLSDGTAVSVKVVTSGTSTGTNPQKVVEPVSQAYATCWGVKPQQNTNASIKPFNDTRYTMVSDALVQQVITGIDPTSGNKVGIFPGTITASQAYYALEQKNYNAVDARKYLIDNYATINTTIADAVNTASGATPITGEWLTTNTAKTKSCTHLIDMYNNFALQLECLRSHFRDISGGVLTAIKMKQESGKMQGIIAAACAKETPTSSPACARLAGLDYATYLAPNATVIPDLKDLNYNLALREQEIQQAILTLQSLIGVIGCTLPPNTTTQKTCPGTTQTVSVSTDILGTGPAGGAAQFTMGNKIGYNSVESLKYSLENISPYFSSSAYREITDQSLKTLSTYLIVPPVSNYSDAVQSVKGASVYFGDIEKLMLTIKE